MPNAGELVKALRSFRSRKQAMEQLVELGQEAVPALIEALDERNEGMRWATIRCLGEIGSDEAIVGLVARLDNPRDAETHFRLGALYQDLGKLGVAEAEYLETLKLNERHVKALNALGWFYYNQDQADQARRMWERTLRFSPMNNEARDSLAKLYNDQALKALDGGRKGDAKRLWKKVLEYDPKNRAARYHMNKHG